MEKEMSLNDIIKSLEHLRDNYRKVTIGQVECILEDCVESLNKLISNLHI